jgi:hypothetical protein
MVSDRLSHLQNEIVSYYKQLAGKETAKRAARLEDKELIQQQIDLLRAEIGGVERDYWLRWQAESSGLAIPDDQAEVVVGELLMEVNSLTGEPKVQTNADLMKLLEEIKTALTNKPKTSASGKLKAAIPLLPGLVSYELELDTEGLLRRVFPTFCQLAEKLKK